MQPIPLSSDPKPNITILVRLESGDDKAEKKPRTTLMLLLGKTDVNEAVVDDTWNANPAQFRAGSYPELLKPILDALANAKGTSVTFHQSAPNIARFSVDLLGKEFHLAVVPFAAKEEVKVSLAEDASKPAKTEKKPADFSPLYMHVFGLSKKELNLTPSCIVSIDLYLSPDEIGHKIAHKQKFDQAEIAAIYTNKPKGWEAKADAGSFTHSIPKETVFPAREDLKQKLDMVRKHLVDAVEKEKEKNKAIDDLNTKKALEKDFVAQPKVYKAAAKYEIVKELWDVMTGKGFYQDTIGRLNEILSDPISDQALKTLPPEPAPKSSSSNPLSLLDEPIVKPRMNKLDFLHLQRDPSIIWWLRLLGNVFTGLVSYARTGIFSVTGTLSGAVADRIKVAAIREKQDVREDAPSIVPLQPISGSQTPVPASTPRSLKASH